MTVCARQCVASVRSSQPTFLTSCIVLAFLKRGFLFLLEECGGVTFYTGEFLYISHQRLLVPALTTTGPWNLHAAEDYHCAVLTQLERLKHLAASTLFKLQNFCDPIEFRRYLVGVFLPIQLVPFGHQIRWTPASFLLLYAVVGPTRLPGNITQVSYARGASN